MVTLQEIQELSIAEQILLVEDIWDNIAQQTDGMEFPDWHKTELDQRWENYVRDPSQTVSWKQIQHDIHKLKGK